MGFFRQEYSSGLPFPSVGDLPNPGIEPRSPTLQVYFYDLSHQGSCPPPPTQSWKYWETQKLDLVKCVPEASFPWPIDRPQWNTCLGWQPFYSLVQTGPRTEPRCRLETRRGLDIQGDWGSRNLQGREGGCCRAQTLKVFMGHAYLYIYIYVYIYIYIEREREREYTFLILHLSNGVSSKLPEADGGQNSSSCVDWPGHGLLPRRPCQLWHQICLSEGNSPQGALLELPEMDPTGSSGDAGLGPQAEPRVKQTSATGKKGDDRCARHMETHRNVRFNSTCWY